MKLLIGAFALTMALTSACSKSDSSLKPGNSAPIDGNYITITAKGYTDADTGEETRTGGYIVDLLEVKNGVSTNTQINLEDKGYSVTLSVVNVNGSAASGATTSDSCVGGPGETTVKDSGLGTRFNFEAKADEEKLVLTFDGESRSYLRLSDEQHKKLRAKIANFTEYNGESCERAASTLDSSESLEETKLKLNEILK